MDVKFHDCPVECPNQPKERYDVNRTTFCKTCPREKARIAYIRSAERVLTVQLGEGHKFDVPQLDTRVGLVSAALDLPADKVRVPLGRLIHIYKSEQSRRDKIQNSK